MICRRLNAPWCPLVRVKISQKSAPSHVLKSQQQDNLELTFLQFCNFSKNSTISQKSAPSYFLKSQQQDKLELTFYNSAISQKKNAISQKSAPSHFLKSQQENNLELTFLQFCNFSKKFYNFSKVSSKSFYVGLCDE